MENITLFVPETKENGKAHLLYADMGTGDNLLAEDLLEGYNGYLNLYRYAPRPEEADDVEARFAFMDGDMLLYKVTPETQDDYAKLIADYLGIPKEKLVVLSAA